MLRNDIKLALELEMRNAISDTVLKKAGEEMAKEIVNLIWQRTAEGIDINGNKWRRYKAVKWQKGKGEINYGTWKKSHSGGGWLVLSGDLKRGTFCKYLKSSQSGNKLSMAFLLYVDAANEKKAEGLMSETGYDRNRNGYAKSSYKFLGLSNTGTWQIKESQRLSQILISKINENVKKMKVNQSVR
jgi:hypothetical protein